MKQDQQAKNQYSYFLETGDLFDLFPNMTGEWEVDKKVFIAQWEKNKEFLKNIE